MYAAADVRWFTSSNRSSPTVTFADIVTAFPAVATFPKMAIDDAELGGPEGVQFPATSQSWPVVA